MKGSFECDFFDLEKIEKEILEKNDIELLIFNMIYKKNFTDDLWDFFINNMEFNNNNLIEIIIKVPDIKEKVWYKFINNKPAPKDLMNFITGFYPELKEFRFRAFYELLEFKNDFIKEQLIELVIKGDDISYHAWKKLMSLKIEKKDFLRIIIESEKFRKLTWQKFSIKCGDEDIIYIFENFSDFNNIKNSKEFLLELGYYVLYRNYNNFSIIETMIHVKDLEILAWDKLLKNNPTNFDIIFVISKINSEYIKKEAIKIILKNNPTKKEIEEIFKFLKLSEKEIEKIYKIFSEFGNNNFLKNII
ncbi:hypothetical protein EOM09_03175 [bacterium]|nr:hypothetical protein [bacterium]